MAHTIRNRVVVITGASAGIGRATALRFADEGAHIVVAARRLDRLEALCDEITRKGARCLVVRTDVSDPLQVQRLLDATIEHFGAVHVWINNAGSGLVGDIEQTTSAEMEQLLRVNYLSAFHGCKAALQQMRRQESGHIINVASLAVRYPLPLHAAYTATKCAMSGLSEALALELDGSGIYVTTVYPGVTATDFTDAMVKHIPDSEGSVPFAATAGKVAMAIVRCAKRPTRSIMILPAPRLVLAVTDLFPSIWRSSARQYLRKRKQAP